MRQKPFSDTASKHASAEPASIRGASRRCRVRNASPTACRPVAHAVDGDDRGPRKP